MKPLVIASIVEGDGEVSALPVLLRRLSESLTPTCWPTVAVPIRVRRDRFLMRDDQFQKYLRLAAAKAGPDGWVLILLDADDDCPAELAPSIADRAGKLEIAPALSVVLANREYEAWFIAGAESLNGKHGFAFDAPLDIDPELPRDAKGWISERIGAGKYREVIHQPAFSAMLDVARARQSSPSFDKLCREWLAHVAPVD
jgi:hypothetical protein